MNPGAIPAKPGFGSRLKPDISSPDVPHFSLGWDLLVGQNSGTGTPWPMRQGGEWRRCTCMCMNAPGMWEGGKKERGHDMFLVMVLFFVLLMPINIDNHSCCASESTGGYLKIADGSSTNL